MGNILGARGQALQDASRGPQGSLQEGAVSSQVVDIALGAGSMHPSLPGPSCLHGTNRCRQHLYASSGTCTSWAGRQAHEMMQTLCRKFAADACVIVLCMVCCLAGKPHQQQFCTLAKTEYMYRLRYWWLNNESLADLPWTHFPHCIQVLFHLTFLGMGFARDQMAGVACKAADAKPLDDHETHMHQGHGCLQIELQADFGSR